MARPDRDGRFRAYPTEWGVDETGDSKLATFICRWSLTEWLGSEVGPDGKQSPKWYPYDSMQAEIVSYTYLEKKGNAGPNEIGISQLVKALGWNGYDFEALANTDWSQTCCQLAIENDTYQGKTKLKVQWIDHWDAEGTGVSGVRKGSAATISKMSERLGAQLRAMSATPVGPPPPPGGPPPGGHATGPTGPPDGPGGPPPAPGTSGPAVRSGPRPRPPAPPPSAAADIPESEIPF